MNDLLLAVEPWAELWSASLWRATWQGTIALAVAWTIARTCTFLSPRIVCWIWRLACVKLLVAFVWIEPVAIALLPAEPAEAIRVIAPVAGGAVVAPIGNEMRAAASDVLVRQPGPSVVQLLLVAWLACVSLRVAITLWQWHLVRRWHRLVSCADSDVLNRLCRQEAARLGVRRPAELGLSSQAAGPQLAGIWRPMVLLSRDVLTLFEPAELRLMLAHELAHQKRRDLLWNWLPTVVGWLFFFHPLVWLLGRNWSAAQEAACDELVIQNRVARPSEYGRLLVKLSTHWPPQSVPTLATAGVLGSYRNLERRIMAMTRVVPFSKNRLLAAASILSAVALLGTVPWRLVAQEPKQQAEALPDDPQAEAKARQDAFQQLKQVGLVMHNYHFKLKSFPAPAIVDREEKPLLSWRVAILPYLEDEVHDKLYARFHLDEPWDSEHNKKLIAEMPAIYACPRSKKVAGGMTVYLAVRGAGTIFEGPGGVSVREITDGTSKTIAVVEVDDQHAVPWTKPADWTFDPANPMRDLGGHIPKQFLCLFGDGSAHAIELTVPKEKIRPFFTRNGREVANF